ncbi:hypothetical protein D3C71_609860 [compost metagenome]
MSILVSFIGTRLTSTTSRMPSRLQPRWRSDQSSSCAYRRCRRAITPVCECTSFGVAMRADSIGIRLTATSHEASSETEMVIAICAMKMLMLLVSPNRLGTNTMQ